MDEQRFLNDIFSGDNAAFQRLYTECRALFLAYFSRHYPGSGISLTDLYQDSIMELWSQIVDGKITRNNLRCSISTYVISVGRNKMREGYRGLQRRSRIEEALTLHPDSYHVSACARTPVMNPADSDEDEKQRLRQWSEFLGRKYEELGYPCNRLLRCTWYEGMSDNDILKEFDGYFANTNVIKSKRYKCHKALLNMFNIWINSQK